MFIFFSFCHLALYVKEGHYECTINDTNSFLITLKLPSSDATKQLKLFIDHLKQQKDELYWSLPHFKYMYNDYENNNFSISFENHIPFNIQYSQTEYYCEYVRLSVMFLLKYRALIKFIIRPQDNLFNSYQHIFIPYSVKLYKAEDNIIDILKEYLEDLNIEFNFAINDLIYKIKTYFYSNDQVIIDQSIQELKFDFFNPFEITDENLFTVRYSKKKYGFFNEVEITREGKKNCRAQSYILILYRESRSFFSPTLTIDFTVFQYNFINVLYYYRGGGRLNYNDLSTYLYYHIKLYYIYVMNAYNNFDDWDNIVEHHYMLNNGHSLKMTNLNQYILE